MFSCKCVAVLARRYYTLSVIYSLCHGWRGLRTICAPKDLGIKLAIRVRPRLKGEDLLGRLSAA